MRGRIRFRERRCQRSDAQCRSTSEQKPELKTDNVAWSRGEGLALNVTGGADGGGLGRRAGSAGESVLRTLRLVSAPRSYSDPAHCSLRLDTGLWWVSPLHLCKHHSSGLTVSSHTQPKYVLLLSQYRYLLKSLIIYYEYLVYS